MGSNKECLGSSKTSYLLSWVCPTFSRSINSVPMGRPDYLESQLKPREIPFLQTGLSPFPRGFQLIGFPGREDGHFGYGC